MLKSSSVPIPNQWHHSTRLQSDHYYTSKDIVLTRSGKNMYIQSGLQILFNYQGLLSLKSWDFQGLFCPINTLSLWFSGATLVVIFKGYFCHFRGPQPLCICSFAPLTYIHTSYSDRLFSLFFNFLCRQRQKFGLKGQLRELTIWSPSLYSCGDWRRSLQRWSD